MCKIKA